MRIHTYDMVHAAAMQTTHQEVTITLAAGETAVAPGTTKKIFTGPGTVTYRAYRDGGLDVMDRTALLTYIPRT